MPVKLQAEGIFRINGDNGQEEQIREQLNRGEVPENIDVHSLAGLIKVLLLRLTVNLQKWVGWVTGQNWIGLQRDGSTCKHDLFISKN